MTVEREGYRYFGAHLSHAAWKALLADAEARSQSVTQRLNELLHVHYKISAKETPLPKPVGRKPKRKPALSTANELPT